ncbi:PaaI family thioesterase [Ovoidimarina sediminis]|uniref:PaaI family thioesterase n=1 Tax=Ovoidimarina sediminis TaxID=3079856 RepID=UPI0029157E6C|nr:PaaI family thioesterase [Rhodophyticola sp. MJ-SS7]MDU8946524.1 PaaI family thioesterase [Rhodophyticola sp. MJ-SS7]
MTPEIRMKVEASFAAQGLMRTLGAELTDLGQGFCTVRVPIRPETGQQHGFAHAGLTFSVGDSAAGYSALSVMPADVEVLTSEMKIHLIRPAAGTWLRAEGKVIKPGRRLCVVSADVYAEGDGADRHVATLLGTMVPTAL